MLKLKSIEGTDTNLLPLPLVKTHCFVTDSDSEALLVPLISVAREYAEARTWRQLISATYELYLDAFPESSVIELPKPPAISVDSITYTDTNETEQTLSADDYEVDTASEPARIKIKSTWPLTYARMNAVKITFKAGYPGTDASDTIPEKIRQAMLLLVKHWFDNRNAVEVQEVSSVSTAEVPITANHLLDMESVREFV